MMVAFLPCWQALEIQSYCMPVPLAMHACRIALDPAELAPALALVRQGIDAQLRNPLHAYHAR